MNIQTELINTRIPNLLWEHEGKEYNIEVLLINNVDQDIHVINMIGKDVTLELKNIAEKSSSLRIQINKHFKKFS